MKLGEDTALAEVAASRVSLFASDPTACEEHYFALEELSVQIMRTPLALSLMAQCKMVIQDFREAGGLLKEATKSSHAENAQQIHQRFLSI